MNKKIKWIRILGLIFIVLASVFIIEISDNFFYEERLQPYLFDFGVNSMGSFFCAALFYGCMKQEGDGTRIFRVLIVLVSACFALNEAMLFTSLVPELSTLCFIFCLAGKMIDLALIFLFYLYLKVTLGFEGKPVRITDKVIPVLLALESLVILSNIFYPVTFSVDAAGQFGSTSIAWIEDIYLAAAAIFSIVLVILCHCPRNQKVAALTFIVFPLFGYVFLGGEMGNASQYGFVQMSLIVMYCVIFNDKSKKLASTQTELNMATEIQTSMLPSVFPAFPDRSEFDIHASMDPAKEVGGDFYDFFLIDDDHLAMVIADVSGKGVPAALFMMSSKILINDHALMGGTPAEILERVNKLVYANNKAHMFVTVWLGILEISTGKLTSSSAGHEYPIINVNGKYELLKDRHGLAIGAMSFSKYVNTEITLKKGDGIFVYTDGVAEATDANNQLFGTDRTVEALNAISGSASQKEVLAGVRAAVDAFVKEAPQFDDLTMLGLRYNGTEEKTEAEERQ